jgi:hypothetical protein
MAGTLGFLSGGDHSYPDDFDPFDRSKPGPERDPGQGSSLQAIYGQGIKHPRSDR